MQVYKEAGFPHRHHHHHDHRHYHQSAHKMVLPNSQNSQHPQHPYNPYPHHQHQPDSPQYTLQSGTSRDASSSSSSSTEPPQDMFVALERLLMGISPFPPSMPANLAEPTCPSLDDQSMSELTSFSSSPMSSSISSAPSDAPGAKNSDVFGKSYEDRESSHPQQQPAQSSYLQPPLLQYHRQQGALSECSARSMSPPASPYSCMSSSPAMNAETVCDMPYWSPSTPSLQVEHQWSNQSSPLVPSVSQHRPSRQQQQQQDQQKRQSSSWGYSLFEQMNSPSGTQDQTLHQSSSNNNNNNLFAMATAGTVPLHARRAARTPPHRRTFSELSSFRAYESTAFRDYHPHRHYRNTTISGSSSSTATTTANGNNGNDNAHAHTSSSTSNVQSINNNSNSNTVTRNIRGGIKSYPCPTCGKPFPTRTQLKSHMAIHVDNFPFPCLYAGCDLHFKRKHDLRRHVDAKHALVKKYLCSGGCGEGFGRRDQMVRHLRRGTCGQGFQTE
ncbi:hypothetical protein BGX28_000995 [Mortierella sp. GBA30]|nr:hypothetical protein BGX28_000995 [Mortierella sp. GBA30]